jgi:ribonuclease BN (tRNA processing enzyme)
MTVVGCSGSYPGPESPASCYLLQAGHEGRTYSLVVDLGNGALGGLQRHVDLADVDAVVLSHLHVDHCIDLASYYVVRTYQPGGMLPPLPVHGPAGGSARVAAASGFPDQTGVDKVFDFFDWQSGRPVQLGPFTVTPAQVAHPVETYALRIEEQGRVLVYSGDSGPSTALVDLASGADLFLCEASFLVGGDNPPDLHLTGREAGLHASRAGVGRLLLTHIPPWHDPARILAEAVPEFSGPVELAETDAVYTV